MKFHNATVCCCVTILLVCLMGASAAPYNIYYTLAKSGQVSLNIYDANGHVVRELLHAAPKSAGAHMVTWDGKEQSGTVVPNAGTCTWKLLATPSGLTADFKINLGNTYPSLYAGATNFFDAYPLGDHETCSALTVDADNIYMGANTAESNPACIKLSKSTNTRMWSCGNFDIFTGAISMARDNANTLYVLGNGLALKDPDTGQNPRGPYQLFKVHADNPYIPNGPYHPNYAAISTKWTLSLHGGPNTDYYAQDMDACNTTIVLMYPEAQRICWVDSNGKQLKWVDFSQMTPGDLTPQGVSVGSDGAVYVTAISKSTPTATGIYTTAGGTPTALVTGLVNPGRLDIDRSNGDIYVIVGDTLGNREYVKRYSAMGQLKNSYGAGMPTDGLYDPKHFHDLADITAMGDGQSFIVAEPYFVRRVIKVQSSDGAILKEWYGGLPWCPWVTPDPDNPNVVWVVGNTNNYSNGGNNYCMRLLVDYATGTYKIHSVYRMDTLCSGIAPSTGFATSWKMIKRQSTGVKYLCAEGDHCALPYLIKVDEVHWELKPVTLCATIFNDPQDIHPQWLKKLAGPNNHSFQWTDLNGDGKPLNDDGTVQANEFTFNPSGFTYWAGTSIGSDFTYYGLPVGGSTLRKLPVSGWRGDVATYDTAAMTWGIPYATMPAAWVNNSLYTSFSAHDGTTGTTYVELQNMAGWDVNTGYAQLVKINDAAGLTAKPVWQVGSYDDYAPGVQQPPAGSIHGVRHFAGRTHHCSVLQDFIGGWATKSGLSDNTNYPIIYVYDDDGLWVGSLFDHVNPTQQRKDFNLCSENACGAVYTDPHTGAVTYFGGGENQIYVYGITGWDKWERHSGSVNTPQVDIPPVATAGALSVMKDVAQTGTLAATDENNDPLTYRIVTNGTKGTAVLTNAATGQFAYTPNHGATGTDTVTFRANDGKRSSNMATIAVTITDCGSPQLEWKFDGNLNDASGHGYAGTFSVGTATYQAVGAGHALVGNGVAGQVSSTSFPTPTAFTVSFWLNPTSCVNFNQGITAINGWGAFSFCATAGGGVYVGTDVPTRMTPYDLGGGTLTTGVWQHFAFTFANGTGKFYKNGVLLCTKTGMTAPTTWGGFEVGSTGTGTIDGLIDDVRVYNTCLSDPAVAQVFGSYAPTDGLKCYWKLDETSGAVADDSSGAGHAGATYNGPTWTAGKPANGLSFNGTDQYVQLASATGLPAANAEQTICCWLYVPATPSVRKTALAVTGSTSGVYLGYLDSTTFGVWKYNNTPLVTTTLPMAGAWHHVAYVKNGSMNYLYIDGTQVATSPTSADISDATTITAGGPPGKNYYPGKLTDGRVSSTDYWPGKLDEVRIYSRALSATEIQALAQGTQ